MDEYQEFLESKSREFEPCGFEVSVDDLNPMLFDWQKDIVKWALHRGRSALFEDCGLGKTPQQLEWARLVGAETGGNVLILTPLAVAQQTLREAAKFGINASVCRDGRGDATGIIITNYERLHYFDANDYTGIVLDESSILKSFNGKTRKALQVFASAIPFRLCCTATPAPNDLIELTNHAEFLGVMSGKEIIALYFKQDGNTTHAWRLKKHAIDAFWRWMASWSIAIRKPSDLGHDDDGFVLPPLNVNPLVVDGNVLPGELFQVEAQGLLDRRRARKASLQSRVSVAADLANGDNSQWLVWCDLNAESEALSKAIDGAVEVHGSDTVEHKESAMKGFSDGTVRVLVTKPSIAGFGMNWQHCSHSIFVGLSDSYEQFYQAVRRCWRFGQVNPVNVFVVTANTEGAVVKNIMRKERQAQGMFENIVKHMSVYGTVNTARRTVMSYEIDDAKGENWDMMLGDSIQRITEIDSDSVGLTVFSPPFPGMYAYTNSPNDIGNCENIDQMIDHFSFLVPELLRITQPGRNCAIHLMQLTAMKSRDGYIGLKDYRGRTIQAMEDGGWRYAGEVAIDKNPQVQATRNKERGLLFKTLATDSSMMRMALADYVLLFRKDGENPVPIRAGRSERYDNPKGWVTEEEWIEWAAPVWYRRVEKDNDGRRNMLNYPARDQVTDGIMETDVLNYRAGKAEEDERHLCPLQVGVVERIVKLWSAPGDLVFSPFAGIGTEGYEALKLYRRFIGIELKRSYWDVACSNLANLEKEMSQEAMPLFTEA